MISSLIFKSILSDESPSGDESPYGEEEATYLPR
jgi:hypothetical protein